MNLTEKKCHEAGRSGVREVNICAQLPVRSDGALHLPMVLQQQMPFKDIRLCGLARLIEPDADRVARWWAEDGIVELEGRTAQELCACGARAYLEAFLLDVIQGHRG